MLTKTRREVLHVGLIALVLLALSGFCPFLTNDFANAEETTKMVDEEIYYVNSDGSIIQENDDELYIDKEDQEDSEDEKDEKSDKKSSDQIAEGEDSDLEENADLEIESASNITDESEDNEETVQEEDEYDIESMASDDEDTDSDDEDKQEKEQEEVVSDDDNAGNEDEKDSEEEETETDVFNGDFPESYSESLAELKEAHPTWNFVAADTGMTWKEALDAEDEGTKNFVDPSVDSDQREHSNKTYDGRWYLANRKTIAHYMDPRNFLNEDDIFQFLVQNYEDGAQTTETVEDIIDGSFMEDGNPGGDYDSYAECIADAGAEADVNPNVLAAMIIMEQGWDGSSLVSGKKDGYEGYYNFYNIGAWTTDSMSSTERGLWYAKGEGEKKTSYGRPWKSPYKAIEGGAEFYHENYISNHQNTYYTKKFNVMNGEDEIGDHQYMTNVSGALDEGKLVKRAYQDNKDLSLTFEIPIYENMPKKVCKLP